MTPMKDIIVALSNLCRIHCSKNKIPNFDKIDYLCYESVSSDSVKGRWTDEISQVQSEDDNRSRWTDLEGCWGSLD